MNDEYILERLFIIALEQEAIDESWGEGFLYECKEKAIWKSFIFNGKPIPAYLPNDNMEFQIPNQSFEENIRDLVIKFNNRVETILSEQVSDNANNDLQKKNNTNNSLQKKLGVTIGVVQDNLKKATSDLEKKLEAEGFEVSKITIDDIDAQNSDKIFQSYLENSAVFIQPFDYSKVLRSSSVLGGHLKIQENIVNDDLKLDIDIEYWLVPTECGGLNKIDEKDKHYPYLIEKSKKAFKGNVEQTVASIKQIFQPPENKVPTVYIEHPLEDQIIMQLLCEKLRELWQQKYHDKPLLFCTPLECDDLRNSKTIYESFHGIIMIYGTKDRDTLISQILTFNQKLDPILKMKSNLGMAVAWAPPRIPRKGNIGYPINFSCNMDDEQLVLEDSNVDKFLEQVYQSYAH